MTELSDELLVAYVDGQLVREQTRAVDKVLEHDDVIARRVEALKDAHGRFESAFEAILAGEMIEILSVPMLPPRVKRKRGNGLAKIGIAVVGIGVALAALVGGYGWPLVLRACSVGMTGSVATMQSAPPKAQSAPSAR
jgi:anti-sigma factor RsiW